MKKKIIFKSLLLMFVLGCPYLVWGQCGTKFSGKYKPATSTSSRTGEWPSYTFNVFIHLVTPKKNKGGVSLEVVKEALAEASTFFEDANICFNITGHEKIVNYEYAINYNDSYLENLLSTNANTNAIDIYVIKSTTNFVNYLGAAEGIPSSALMIFESGLLNGSTLAHELGHCFGLLHTDGQGACAELVDNSNCANCGDSICDTPAEPTNIDPSDIVNCIYTGNATDPNGDLYTPDPTNLMFVANKECRDNFTPLQNEAMCAAIDDNQVLIDALVARDRLIQNWIFPFQLGFSQFNDYTIAASQSISIENSTFESDSKISFKAGEEIIISPTSHIKLGAEFHAFIENPVCDLTTSGAELRTSTPVIAKTLDNPEQSEIASDPDLRLSAVEIDIQVVPNPFMESTEIKIDNPTLSEFTVEIIDYNGRLIQTYQSTSKERNQTIKVLGNDMDAGYYFYRIIADKTIKTGKLIKI